MRFALLLTLITTSALAVPTSAPVDELALANLEQPPDVPGVRVASLSTVPSQLEPLAVAQTSETPAPAAPGLGQQLVDLLFSEKGFGLLAVLVGALGGLVATNEVRRRRIALATYHAFNIVEDLSKETDNKVDDKVAEGLKALNAYMLANGWRALKPGEQEVAKLGFQSLNGASKLAEKIAVTSAEKAAASPQ